MVKYFLELPELVQRKRAETPDNTSTLNPDIQHGTVSNYTCKICAESLGTGSHNKAIDHFALHIWCDYTDKLYKNGQIPDECSPQNEDLDNFAINYGLETWLAHHKAFFGLSYADKSRKIRLKFTKR